MNTPLIPKLPAMYEPPGEAAVQCSAWLAGQFLPWNHPLRQEAEEAVKQHNWYCQTHLPSDNNKQLAEMFLEFLRSHWPANDQALRPRPPGLPSEQDVTE